MDVGQGTWVVCAWTGRDSASGDSVIWTGRLLAAADRIVWSSLSKKSQLHTPGASSF